MDKEFKISGDGLKMLANLSNDNTYLRKIMNILSDLDEKKLFLEWKIIELEKFKKEFNNYKMDELEKQINIIQKKMQKRIKSINTTNKRIAKTF